MRLYKINALLLGGTQCLKPQVMNIYKFILCLGRLRAIFLRMEFLDKIENIPPLVEMSCFSSGTVTHSKIKISSPFSTNRITCILINYEPRETFPLNDFVFVVENGFA